jgi:hypothetical protein
VADDFITAAMVRRMANAVDHRHVGKSAGSLLMTSHELMTLRTTDGAAQLL